MFPFQTRTAANTESAKLRQIKFVSPYARYLAVLPFAEKQRLEEIARKADLDRKKKLCPENTLVFQNDEVGKINAESKMTLVRAAPTPLADMGMTMPRRKRPVTTTISKSEDNQPTAGASLVNIGEGRSSQHDAEHEHNSKRCRIDDSPSQASTNQNSSPATPSQLNATPVKNALNDHLSNQTPNRQSNKKKNKRNKGNTPKVAQSSNTPVQFDYSKVDFSKFQGGSHKERPNPEFKSKFQGKVS